VLTVAAAAVAVAPTAAAPATDADAAPTVDAAETAILCTTTALKMKNL